MEDQRILKQRSFLGRCPVVKLISLWLAIVGGFAASGFYWPTLQIQGSPFSTESAIQGAVLLGGMGVGVATSITGALCILANVHLSRLGKVSAVLLLAVLAVVSGIVTVVTTETVADNMPEDWHILQGESRMGVAYSWGRTTIIAGGVFTISTALVIGMRRLCSGHKDNQML